MIAGQTFDRYQIIRELGGGNMGKVYLAVREDTGQQIALKIVDGGDSPEAAERISVETEGAELQQKLSSNGVRDPRVVAVQRIFRNGEDLAIEMEYVDGEDLYKVLRRGPLDPEHAARLALALTDMLGNLGHATPFVHGDLKPSNIIITRDDQVKVIDFGIAKALEKSKLTTYNPYQSAGYASPERLSTTRVDVSSDLWSTGVILYEMVAGRRPFGASDEDLRTRVQFGPDPLPDSVPLPLKRIIFKLLAPTPAERYAAPADCAADLQRFLAGDDVTAPDPDQATRRTVPAAVSEATRRTMPLPVPGASQPTPPAARSPRRKWLPYVNLAVFGTILLACIGFASSQYNVRDQADDLQRKVASRQMSLTDAWTSWQDIAKRCKFSPMISGLRQSLESALVESADEVIIDYRRDQPTSSEGDWARAFQNLQHGLELDPNAKPLIGRLEVCDGHLLRIRAHGLTRQKSLNSAISKFESAARLMPDSRDPYLGLARIYTYDLHEYEKGTEMISEAVKRGHAVGKREKAQMADALRVRGMHLEQQADQFRDMPDQEKQYLQKAREDFKSAAQYYSELDDYTKSAPTLYRDVLQRIQTSEDRLSQIR